MQTDRWLEFLSSKLQLQISLESTAKIRSWALALLALFSLGAALHAAAASEGRAAAESSKMIYLIFYHAFLIFGFYLPSIFEKGLRPVSGWLGIRDHTSLTAVYLVFVLFAWIAFSISLSWSASVQDMGLSGFSAFAGGWNILSSAAYLFASFFAGAGFLFLPRVLVKVIERGGKVSYGLLAFHAVSVLLTGAALLEVSPAGSPSFFEGLRLAGLFWIAMLASLLFIGSWLKRFSFAHLAALDLDLAAGRLERHEDILARYEEAFISPRFASWIHQLSHFAAARSHEIARGTHDAVGLVSREKPSELDLRQVEEHYRRAQAAASRLEKKNQSFLLASSFFELHPPEQKKLEELKDVFSRELRHAHLELASVRKHIDERLVALKNSEGVIPVEVKTEKVGAEN